MQPISFDGATEIKKPESMTDEECMSVWAYRGVDALGYAFFMEAWKPSYEDLQALSRGEPIWIKIYSNGLPPISIFTMDENGNCNDAT